MYPIRKKMAITLRFRLRTGQTTGDKPRQLYIRLKVNGTTCSDYASGVYVRPDKWNSGYQKLTGYSKLAQQTNQELEAIEAEHKRLLSEMERLYQAGILPMPPVAETIKQHWTRQATLIPTLLEAYKLHLAYLQSLDGTPDERNKRTLDKWRNGQDYLKEYIAHVHAERLTVDLVSVKWAEGFYHYLVRKPLSQATAARFVGYLRASITYMVDTQRVSANPIGGYFPDKGPDKPIYFLENEHLERLWALDTDDYTHGVVRDWLLLMCYTGMDQPDLERYVKNPARYHEQTDDGVMIAIPRGKTDLVACIPLLDEVNQLLALYPNGIPSFTNQTMNRWTWIIEKQIGFDQRLTVKICRKTAGAVFLQKGFRIEEVSKILGHSSMQTTIRHYVKVTGAMVKAGMKRVNSQRKP